jgi:uncharacterized protein
MALKDGSSFKVHLAPRAAKDGIVGVHDQALKIRIKAPPVDGKANEALLKFLAKTLKVKTADVSILTGHASRKKTIAVSGLTPAEVTKRLNQDQSG